MCVFYLHACSYTTYMQCLWKPEKDVREGHTDVVSYLVIAGKLNLGPRRPASALKLSSKHLFSQFSVSLLLGCLGLFGSVKLLYLVFFDYLGTFCHLEHMCYLCAFPSSLYFCLLFWGSVSLCRPGWPRTYCVGHVFPELTDPPALPSQCWD